MIKFTQTNQHSERVSLLFGIFWNKTQAVSLGSWRGVWYCTKKKRVKLEKRNSSEIGICLE